MVDKRVRVILEASAGRMVAGFRQGEAAAGRFATSIAKNREAWDRIGDTAMIAGGAMAVGLGLATKAAIDWESAWAGVAKTVDGTPAQMAELESGLRGLAKELPATHEEIAGVAEAAGQLGVARKDVIGFTETAIALGESTNLSAEEAATSLAQFSNIMGTVSREGVEGYERLGSTLVELGNNGASTEADIMRMSLRLAGAGQQIGATEADILAMSNALTSVGIEAELGGGAMSRGLLQMNSAVISGGEELDKFAEIAGMTASEFATAWREDPIQATNAFIGGLGRIGASGGDATAALESVGLSGTQNAQVFLRAAGASDLMSESLKMGADAWKSNSALAEEASKRYETTESRLQIARNTFKDAAIDLGSVLGPALATVAEKAAGVANAFVQLPGPVKSAIAGIGGVASAALLLGGATIKAVGWTQDMRKTLQDVGMMTPRVERGLKGAARGAQLLGKALMATMVAGSIGEALQDGGSAMGIEKMTGDILDGADAVTVLNKEIRAGAADVGFIDTEVHSLGDALKVAFDPSSAEKFSSTADGALQVITLGMADMQQSGDEAAKVFKTMDDQLAGLVQAGYADQAAQIFKQYEAEAKKAGVSTDELKAKLPGYTEAVASAGNQSKLAGDDLGGMGDEAQTTEEKIDELSDAITGLGDAMLGERGSARDYQAALDDMAKSIKENGNTLDITTEKGRANEAALDGLAESTQEWAAATLESGGSAEKVQGILDNGRKKWMDYATSMGMPKAEAKALADELFKIPADVKAELSTPGAQEAIDQAATFGATLGLIPGSKSSNISTPGAEESKSRVLDLGTSIQTLYGKTVTVKEDGATVSEANIRELDGSLVGLPSKKTVQVAEIGSTKSGEMVVQFKNKVYAIPKSKTAQIREQGAGNARAKVMDLNTSIKLLNGKTVMVGEDGAQNATGRVRTMDGAIFGLKGKTVTVREIGATASGDRVVRFKNNIYEVPTSRTSNVTANVHGLWDVGALVGQIAAVKSKTVTVRAIGAKVGSWFNADGGMYAPSSMGMWPTFADGGVASFRGKSPQIRPAGGAGVTWAEEGAGPWEAFISGHPGKKSRSIAILDQVAARLGRATMPLESVKFASGGVYGDWQKWLREARRMSARGRYRFEDGSRKIRVFEDGTAQWRGYGRAPAEARRVIARLNAAQDRYEDALNAKERRQAAARSQPRRSTASRYTGQHSAYYIRKQAEWAAIRKAESRQVRRGSAPRITPKPRTGSFTRITPPPAKQHMVVPERWGRFERTPATTSSVSSPMSAQAMESAITSAFSRVQVTTNIGGRDFKGVMERVTNDRKGR